MQIRTYQKGDEAAQLAIYNEAAGELPRFKAATLDEMRRRFLGADFDPSTRLYAVEGKEVVGYANFHGNGRLSYPWCRKGREAAAEPLFAAVLQAMKSRGISRAFAAYRGDWPTVGEFFLQHGFAKAREMVNFVLDLIEMPTPAARPSNPFSPLEKADLPDLFKLGAGTIQSPSEAQFEKHLFENPYFPASAVFVLRSRTTNVPVACGILVSNASYANPKQVDSAMPCFRLGAFGSEGMSCKRINGLFSFLAPAGSNVGAVGLDLMGHAAFLLRETDDDCLAAQVPSDASHLLRFYQQHFRRQGSFPIFEKLL